MRSALCRQLRGDEAERCMGSAFPGMDPYLEDPAYWSDFHHVFIADLREAVAKQLPSSYFAKIDEHIVIVDPEFTTPPLIKPDVMVGHKPSAESRRPTAVVEVDLEPEIMSNVYYLDPLTQGYIEIRRFSDRELVSVIEVLSPSNKNGGRGQYLEKRELLLRKGINIVEIDLLRRGRRISLNKPLPSGDYFAFISRFHPRAICEVYHWNVRRVLPVLPVPLHGGDHDARISLQKVFETTYERGGYGNI